MLPSTNTDLKASACSKHRFYKGSCGTSYLNFTEQLQGILDVGAVERKVHNADRALRQHGCNLRAALKGHVQGFGLRYSVSEFWLGGPNRGRHSCGLLAPDMMLFVASFRHNTNIDAFDKFTGRVPEFWSMWDSSLCSL